MADNTERYVSIFEAIDKMSAPLKRMEAQARKLEQQIDRLTVKQKRLNSEQLIMARHTNQSTASMDKYTTSLTRSNREAFRLNATLSRASRTMRSMDRGTSVNTGLGGSRRAIRDMNTDSERLVDNFTQFRSLMGRLGTGGFDKLIKGLGPLGTIAGGLGSVATTWAGTMAMPGATMAAGVGAAGMYGAAQYTQTATEKALEFEKNKVSLVAASGDPVVGEKLYSTAMNAAADSSSLDPNAALRTTQTLLEFTKEPEEISKYLKLFEKVKANTGLGDEDILASFRQAIGGDMASAKDRFNTGSAQLEANGFTSGQSGLQNLDAVDKIMNSRGVDDSYLNAMNNTGAGKLAKAQERVNLMMAETGSGILEALKPQLDRFNTFLEGPGGQKLSEQLTKWVSGVGISLFKTIDKFAQDGPRIMGIIGGSFKNLTSLITMLGDNKDKVLDLFEKSNKFTSDLINAGPQIFEAAKSMMTAGQVLLDSLVLLAPAITEVGNALNVLFENMNSIIRAITGKEQKKWDEKNSTEKFGLMGKWLGYGDNKTVNDVAEKFSFSVPGPKEWFSDEDGSSPKYQTNSFFSGPQEPVFDGSHANGLERVPFDGYKAILHKGERVQTAQEVRTEKQKAASVAAPSAATTVQLNGDIHLPGVNNAEDFIQEILNMVSLKGALG